jgi:hypothetical protein
LFDASATGIFVCWRTLDSVGTGLIVMSGCLAWNSFATSFQSASPAPWLALCHQTSVTDLDFRPPLEAAKPTELAASALTLTATTPATASGFQRFMTLAPPSAGALRSPWTGPPRWLSGLIAARV